LIRSFDHGHRVAAVFLVVRQEVVQLQQVEREQQPVLVGHGAIGPDHGGGLGLDAARHVGVDGDQVRETAMGGHEQAHGQLVLALPMPIDRAFRDPGLGGDQLGGGRVHALVDKDFEGGAFDLGLGVHGGRLARPPYDASDHSHSGSALTSIWAAA
jgi:hypothetical protein